MKKIAGSLPFETYEHGKMSEVYDRMTLKQLLVELDKAMTLDKTDPDKDRWDWSKIHPLRREIGLKLGYSLAEDIDKVIKEVLNEVIGELNDNFTKFKEHRHDKDTSYSEKPVW